MTIPSLESKSIVLIISFICLRLHLRMCLHETYPALEFRILASSLLCQAQAPHLLSSTGVAPPFSAQPFSATSVPDPGDISDLYTLFMLILIQFLTNFLCN